MLSAFTWIGLGLGIFLSLIFLVFFILVFRSEGISKASPNDLSLAQRLAGMTTLAVGLLMLVGWLNFMDFGEANPTLERGPYILHIFLMFFSSVALLLAGVAMLRSWKKSVGLFFSAIFLVSFSLLYSLMQYGNQGHPILMNGIAVIVGLVLVYFIGLIYAFEHFVFQLDLSSEKPKKS